MAKQIILLVFTFILIAKAEAQTSSLPKDSIQKPKVFIGSNRPRISQTPARNTNGVVTGDLKDRGVIKDCLTGYCSDEAGKVGVLIWVDKNGVVTRAEAKQKISQIAISSEIQSAVEKCAKSYRFSPSSDAEEQTGTIMFEFKYEN